MSSQSTTDLYRCCFPTARADGVISGAVLEDLIALDTKQFADCRPTEHMVSYVSQDSPVARARQLLRNNARNPRQQILPRDWCGA